MEVLMLNRGVPPFHGGAPAAAEGEAIVNVPLTLTNHGRGSFVLLSTVGAGIFYRRAANDVAGAKLNAPRLG
jgi:hypothetical protein